MKMEHCRFGKTICALKGSGARQFEYGIDSGLYSPGSACPLIKKCRLTALYKRAAHYGQQTDIRIFSL